MKDMDLEQMIDNGIETGEYISMDDILDNVVEEDSVDGSDEWVLDESHANKVIIGLINDPTITDEYWEEKLQHIRDDLCFQLEQYGCVDVKELADFHGSAVYQMVGKYL